MPLTLQVFERPQQLLEAIGDAFDNAAMSIVIGTAGQQPDEKQGVWMIVHGHITDGDQTIQTSHDLSLSNQTIVRLACCSHNLETYVVTWPQSDAEILSIASQIFETIADALVVAGVPPVRAAFGPKPLVGGLLAGWSARASGPLTIREDAFLTTRLAYLTSSRFVEAQQRPRESGNSSRQPEVLDIATLKHDRDPEEVKKIRSELAQCIMAFWSSLSSESTPTAEKMINDVLNNGEAGRLWICHASGDEEDTDGIKIKGYLYLGRETRKTVTIRNVYTKDAFRGRGIASELVATACRWWLLEGEGDRRKEAVVLFVEPDNPAAMRTYLRCGFRVEEETWECRGFDGINMGAF